MNAFREADILTIPVRTDLVVRVHGIPHDLTEIEAAKIANIILAHAPMPPATFDALQQVEQMLDYGRYDDALKVVRATLRTTGD